MKLITKVFPSFSLFDFLLIFRKKLQRKYLNYLSRSERRFETSESQFSWCVLSNMSKGITILQQVRILCRFLCRFWAMCNAPQIISAVGVIETCLNYITYVETRSIAQFGLTNRAFRIQKITIHFIYRYVYFLAIEKEYIA